MQAEQTNIPPVSSLEEIPVKKVTEGPSAVKVLLVIILVIIVLGMAAYLILPQYISNYYRVNHAIPTPASVDPTAVPSPTLYIEPIRTSN